MQDDLDQILDKRVVPEAADDLAERIVAATAAQKPRPVWVMIFNPAYAAGVVLVLVAAAAMYFSTGMDMAVVEDDGSGVALAEVSEYIEYEMLLAMEESFPAPPVSQSIDVFDDISTEILYETLLDLDDFS